VLKNSLPVVNEGEIAREVAITFVWFGFYNEKVNQLPIQDSLIHNSGTLYRHLRDKKKTSHKRM